MTISLNFTTTMTKVIRTEEQYEDALERIYALLQESPKTDTPEGDELDLLATLAEAYEAVQYPMSASDPVAYLKSKMKQHSLSQTDLIPYIGDKTQVSKVMNRKRELTLSMIKKISSGLNIPLVRLIGN